MATSKGRMATMTDKHTTVTHATTGSVTGDAGPVRFETRCKRYVLEGHGVHRSDQPTHMTYTDRRGVTHQVLERDGGLVYACSGAWRAPIWKHHQKKQDVDCMACLANEEGAR